ncbi:MAG: Selenocysteine-containing peroxiredoxin PrxU [Firmicutes bacterium ADurb.Bin506]|jgi:alkyl hydroperoxide reductase subunit AhpC|nr:MAG: Selenocysteine-containing peroxiredoxin PrxU [Firmicutes bacterium ADurb.Bin506]
MGVEVLSVSVDSVFAHKMWDDHELSKMVTAGAIPYAMLSDQDGRIGRMYGVFDERSGTNARGRFIIDPDGTIQAIEVLTPAVGRNIHETIRQIRAFQKVREAGGAQVMPAGWKPGKTTLTPGPELVGNVWRVWKVSEAFED